MTKKSFKLRNVVAIAICLAGITMPSSCKKDAPIEGNGILRTSEKTVSVFEKIVVSGDAEVRYYASEEYRVVFTIDENLHDYVEIFTQNNVLNIGLKKNVSYSRITKFSVEIYSPVLTGVSLDGFVDFESMDIISTPAFKAVTSGSVKVKSAIECEDFSAKIDGLGEMTITGNSKDARIDIFGDEIFDGKEFTTKNAIVNMDGFGKVYICVTDNLKVNISGSGTVYYWGDPKIEITVDGDGKIIKM
jgi:hypothetical protein